MINGRIDEKQLERQLRDMAARFGDENQTAVAKWGVAVCRRLVKTTQAWGDNKEAKDKQVKTIWKDANRAIFAVSKMSVVNQLMSGKMSGLVINGELIKFERRKLLKTPQEVNAWIDEHRTDQRGRVRIMSASEKAVAPNTVMKAAVKIRSKKVGQAKGAWIGAAQEIARHGKGKIRGIGKNVANYAHKFASGGNAVMKKSTWDPVGTIINTVSYVATEHVLKKSAMKEAVNEAGKEIISQYEKTMSKQLKK